MADLAASPRAFAIVPAAGESRRMGRDKAALAWGDAAALANTVLDHVVAAWLASRVAAVVVVTGRDVAARNEFLFARIALSDRVRVCKPEPPPAEMKASVRFALDEIDREFSPTVRDAFLVAPADMPWLRPGTIDRIAAACFAGAAVVVPVHADHRGHPIALSWRLAEEVRQLGENESLKTLIERQRANELLCDASVLGDLDTPEDYERMRARYSM